MREGVNPQRQKKVDAIDPVVFLVVTHLPNTNGYHAERLEVVKLCLNSMRHNAEHEHSFFVWDNGSCNELRSWLQFDFKPDMLMLSKNVGKTAARTSAITMLPPRSIVAYSDDDILYMDNWLEPQLELLQHFPNVSTVTAYPVRTAFRWACENTIEWAKGHKLDVGRFIPQEWEDDFCVSIGRDPAWHIGYTINDKDYRVTYKGKQAYCTSHHCQFVGYADHIKPHLHYDNMAMGDEKPFDVAMDRAGLRLATVERYTRHIGNKIDEGMMEYA